MGLKRFTAWAGLCLLLLGLDTSADQPRTTTAVYRGSAVATPPNLDFRIGDRLGIRVEPKELSKKLTGRSVRVDATIQWLERIDVSREETGGCCGFLCLGTCYKETQTRVEPTLPIHNTSTVEYEPFLHLGPVLTLTTVAGSMPFPLHGAGGLVRDVLGKGGYTYVALHSGTLDFGQLVLPANAFHAGPETPTPNEEAAGKAWVEKQCEGKRECRVVSGPTFTVTRGTVELKLIVEIHRPQQPEAQRP